MENRPEAVLLTTEEVGYIGRVIDASSQFSVLSKIVDSNLGNFHKYLDGETLTKSYQRTHKAFFFPVH